VPRLWPKKRKIIDHCLFYLDFGDGDKRKAEAGNLLRAWAVEVDALARGPSWRFTQCLAMDRTLDIPIEGEHFTPEQWLTCGNDAEAVKPDLRCSCQGHSESVGADVGNESTESRSAFQPLRIKGVSRGHNSLGAESLWRRQVTAGGAEKSQQCQKYFLQYSVFTSEIHQVRTWGAKLVCYQWGAEVW